MTARPLSAAELDRRGHRRRARHRRADDRSSIDRPIKKLPTLRGRTVANLFYEASTRTRIRFELAAKRLSADSISFSATGSSVSKGESLKDTVRNIEAMGVDVVVMPARGLRRAALIARNGATASVINAGDGSTSTRPRGCSTCSPCAASSGGDGRPHGDQGRDRRATSLHSRVARSNIWG